jgi:uncharacterized membrane protein
MEHRCCFGWWDNRLMSEDDREAETRAVDRLTLFSDAVVAIAITLLAIDLPLPEGDSVAQFLASARHHGDQYAAFLISFFAIAAAWRDHHGIFQNARRVDSRLLTLNTFWLLMIVLNPFATRLLTVPGKETIDTHALRYSFYAVLQVLESGLIFAMLARMISRGLVPATSRGVMTGVARQSWNLILGFGLSIPVFFVTPYAWIMWIVVPLLLTQVRRVHRRARGHPKVT